MIETTTLVVNRLSHSTAFQHLWQEWEDLDRKLTPRTPFTSPIWNQLWWKHFSRAGMMRLDEFFLHEVRTANGDLVAVAPLMRTYEPGVGPLRMSKIQFFGTDPSLTEIRGLVCHVRHQDAVLRALVRHFSETENNWDLLKWTGIRAEGIGQLSTAKLKSERQLPDYIIKLPSRWEELHSTLSNNTRKSIRKGYEFLERDGHRFALRAVGCEDVDDDSLRRFFQLHRARSSAVDMKQHRDNFHTTRSRKFLDEVIGAMASRGLVRFFELEVDGKAVASRIAFVLGGDLYLYFSEYDPDWRKYGVMTTLVVEIIKWAIERGFSLLNLSTGSDQSKLRWLPTEILFHDVVQSTASMRSQLALRSEVWRRGRLKSML